MVKDSRGNGLYFFRNWKRRFFSTGVTWVVNEVRETVVDAVSANVEITELLLGHLIVYIEIQESVSSSSGRVSDPTNNKDRGHCGVNRLEAAGLNREDAVVFVQRYLYGETRQNVRVIYYQRTVAPSLPIRIRVELLKKLWKTRESRH